MKEKTKEELVAEFLREGIISGRFARGQKLKQAQVAYMLGLSITPVREAFKLLEAEGYLLGNSRRGVVVAPFDLAHAQEMLDLRISLESQLALAAMDRLAVAVAAAYVAVQVAGATLGVVLANLIILKDRELSEEVLTHIKKGSTAAEAVRATAERWTAMSLTMAWERTRRGRGEKPLTNPNAS